MIHELNNVSGILFSFDHRLEGKCLDLLSHSLNKFLIKEMYRDQLENLYVDIILRLKGLMAGYSYF